MVPRLVNHSLSSYLWGKILRTEYLSYINLQHNWLCLQKLALLLRFCTSFLLLSCLKDVSQFTGQGLCLQSTIPPHKKHHDLLTVVEMGLCKYIFLKGLFHSLLITFCFLDASCYLNHLTFSLDPEQVKVLASWCWRQLRLLFFENSS